MKKIVQKFGGTSLNCKQKQAQAVSKIKKAIDSGYNPVIVVSAMGRKGDPYATDTLIDLAQDIIADINPREKDLLMACGEIISTVIMVQNLKKDNLEAVALTGGQAGIITNNDFGKAHIEKVNCEQIIEILNNNKIPVVAGFQGKTVTGDITTIGRGGSDTTASILAAAIDALYIDVFTDVAGVMTADPGLVKNAQILKEVSYKEVCELAYQGARVLHPMAAEIAKENNIPIKVKSIIDNNQGTIIHNSNMRKIKGNKLITGVASRNDIVFAKIIPREPAEYATGLKIFNLMAANNISVDFINIRPNAISFIIKDDLKNNLKEIMEKNKFSFILSDDFVKVSVVGGGMTGQPGVMAKIVDALNKEKIAVYQTTDSHTTISCLIKKDQEKVALNVIHKAFSLGEL